VRGGCVALGCRLISTTLATIVAVAVSSLPARAEVAVNAAPPSLDAPGETRRMQALVDDLRTRLALGHDVHVAIVPGNPKVVSVKPLNDGSGGFQLAVEAGILGELTEDDRRAVIAHELGHVWIFTHHPFLHTESLANEIAMRVVTRESLEQVYEKLSARGSLKGQARRFAD
jgi:hypothetical protein